MIYRMEFATGYRTWMGENECAQWVCAHARRDSRHCELSATVRLCYASYLFVSMLSNFEKWNLSKYLYLYTGRYIF